MSPFCSVTDHVPPLDNVSLYKIWAPETAVWSPWVKPVPFAFWPRPLKSTPTQLRPEITPALFPPSSAHCALLIDLPGGESVRCGLLLASLGYQPVPVFASCPLSSAQQGLHPCRVDVEDIITALVESAPQLAVSQPSSSAPPAFLIDSLRQAPNLRLTDEYFDNRSAIFASDFPSAEMLLKQGISHILIVRDDTIPTAPDLGHALSHWRTSGLLIDVTTSSGATSQIDWPAHSMFGKIYHQFKLLLSLKPNEQGGYGRFVPESSGG